MTDQNTAVMTVEFSLTKQAEAYTSIRVGGTIPVFVTPDTDLASAFAETMTSLRAIARAEVDAEFESVDQPAPYSTARRGYLLAADDMVAIVPEQISNTTLPGAWSKCSVLQRGHRIGYLQEHARKRYVDNTMIDCSDGDVAKLPRIEAVELYLNSSLKLAVLALADGFSFELQRQAKGWWSSQRRTGRPETNRFWALKKSSQRTDGEIYLLLDCRDGNFNPVREYLTTHAEPEVEIEDIFDEEAEGYDEEDYDDFGEEDYDENN